ncbi:hypothetical protein [Wenyingzhuangia sp. IMCC45467]
MNTYKVLYSGWIKYLLLGFIAFLYTSCGSNQYYTYYDGIYEEPIHVPNTVFSEEMNRVNGLSSIELAPINNFSNDTSQNNNINPNATYQGYNNTDTSNNGSNVTIYIDSNIDPYWNNGWYDPYWDWGYGNRWNSYGWNNYRWNNFYWGNNFYDPYNNWGWNWNWGWNHPYYGFGSPYNNWYGYGYGYNSWWRPTYYIGNSRNQSYRNNSNSYRQNNRRSSNQNYYNTANNKNSNNSRYYNNNNTNTNKSYRRTNTQSNNQTQSRRSYTPQTNSTPNYNNSSSSRSSSSSSSSGSSYRSNSNSYRRR